MGGEPFSLKLALMIVPPVITAFVRTESLGLPNILRQHLLALFALPDIVMIVAKMGSIVKHRGNSQTQEGPCVWTLNALGYC